MRSTDAQAKPGVLAGLAAVALLWWMSAPAAQPLPDPLTLEAALAQIAADHPVVESARAELELATAQAAGADPVGDWEISLNARAQWIGPSDNAAIQDHEDHKLSLNADALLYEFGRGSARASAASAQIEQYRWQLVERVQAQRLLIMRAYFDVLLADLQLAADTEAMTMTFLRYDRLRERAASGQVSDLDLLPAQTAYQGMRARRAASESRQRHARELLALAMDRPGELSARLVEPPLVDWSRPLPAFESVLQAALSQNPRLLGLRRQHRASLDKLAVARGVRRPALYGGAEVASYSREENSSDEWQLRLLLRVPLFQGDTASAGVAAARARTQSARAELAAFTADLRATLLAVWQQVPLLRLRREEMTLNLDYRDLYLDRSRALYELEEQADLGDAMAEYSAARVEATRVTYEHTYAWQRLQALSGAGVTQWAETGE